MKRENIQKFLKQFSLRTLIIGGFFLLSLFVFAFIVNETFREKEDAFDLSVMAFFSGHSNSAIIQAMRIITFFGSSTFLFPAYVVLIGLFYFQKKLQEGVDILVIALTSTVLMFGLKLVFHRLRPPTPLIKGITTYSFPSGHALSSFIFSGILIYLIWKESVRPLWKYLSIGLLLLFSISIGISRIVLNVHYATDVIAGFCLGFAWVIFSFWILSRIRRRGNSMPVVK